MAKKPLGKNYNPEIDFWKFIFAVFVFLFHVKKKFFPPPEPPSFFKKNGIF